MVYIKKEIEEEQEFKPVTLVIETAEELAALWHRTNMSNKTFEDTYENLSDSLTEYGACVDKIWKVLDDECVKQKMIDKRL